MTTPAPHLSRPDCRHPQAFASGNPVGEANTRRAVILTAVMMVVEIAAGIGFGSMALLADGWHMGTHTLALGLTLLAYAVARRHAGNPRYAFGTWKVEVLGGYTSALLLMLVAAAMVWESISRLLNPTTVQYREAMLVAVIGLVVNLVCAWWLKDDHSHHGHGHGHSHDHDHDHDHDEAGTPTATGKHHADLNLRAAYLHVLADAATSVLAIIALAAGWLWGANWMDPAMGVLGSVLITWWAIGLLRSTSRILLDAEMDDPIVARIRQRLATLPALDVVDLHVWQVASGRWACVLSVRGPAGLDTAAVHAALAGEKQLAHLSVEIANGPAADGLAHDHDHAHAQAHSDHGSHDCRGHGHAHH